MQRGAWIGLCLVLCAALAPAQETAESVRRPYRLGPLTAEDFQAKPPDGARFWAWTETDVDFSYRYRYQTTRKQTVVTLTEAEVWSVVKRDKSWNRRLDDPLLLDHEQGHFDLAQIQALAAHARLQQAIKDKSLEGRAADKDAAVQALEKNLHAVLQPFLDATIASHRQYDDETSNGNDSAAQAIARRTQKERLQALIMAAEKSSK